MIVLIVYLLKLHDIAEVQFLVFNDIVSVPKVCQLDSIHLE